jgi:hypothetical protein
MLDKGRTRSKALQRAVHSGDGDKVTASPDGDRLSAPKALQQRVNAAQIIESSFVLSLQIIDADYIRRTHLTLNQILS